MFEKILFATDLSLASTGVVPYVLEIARLYHSKVFAMHVKTAEWDDLQEQETKRLDGLLDGIPHKVVITEGDIRTNLLNFIERENIDLIAVGTHGRTGLGRILLGSVAEALLRQAPCPVLTVGPQAWLEVARAPAITEMVYATDFTPPSEAACSYAISLAGAFRSRLTVLHVQAHPASDPQTQSRDTTLTLRRLQEAVTKETELWCEPYCMVEEGEAPEKILEVAAKYAANLVVMGARPHGVGMATHITRPTAHRVILGAACPVLTARNWRKRVHEHARSRNVVEAADSPELCGA